MILSKQEKEAVKLGLPVFTVRTAHSFIGHLVNEHECLCNKACVILVVERIFLRRCLTPRDV